MPASDVRIHLGGHGVSLGYAPGGADMRNGRGIEVGVPEVPGRADPLRFAGTSRPDKCADTVPKGAGLASRTLSSVVMRGAGRGARDVLA